MRVGIKRLSFDTQANCSFQTTRGYIYINTGDIIMDNTLDSLLRVNRFLLSSLGQWPQQDRISKTCTIISAIFFLITQGYLQTGGMIAAWCDQPIFMESIPPVLISIVCVFKFINFNYNADKMRTLLESIQSDWNSINDEEEMKILNSWTKDSRKNTIMYAGAVYGSMVPFMLGPLVPIFCKLLPEGLLPANSSIASAKPLMFHVEYFYDVEKYYYPLLIHSYFGTMTYITVVIAIDTMFMVYVQHACAIFVVVGNRLEHLVDHDNININLKPNISNDESYSRMVKCIIEHSKALEYAQLIESANSFSFFFQLGFNMITISFTGFQAITKLDRPDEAFRYATFTIAQTFVLFFLSWPSQRLADESTRIIEATTRSAWYLTSIRSRKLLQLFILRSSVPCQLTAGTFYILNMENFSAVVRTSMSYFMVLCSMQ
ncbi:odorant receptor 13a-like isoform X2 [Microplitis mediator]|uniref:odorant receptor 13a-like isoform X2 n=1 Tax=Microplitis mediator TaxID=375433 RepID=UPI002552D908|nr:odorant receptor 13a-like isoform X2 [Microplitis mediator]